MAGLIMGYALASVLTPAHPAAITAVVADVATPWYLTRAFAVSAYIMLTCSVVFGILRTLARRARENLSWIVDELHQFVALLAAALVAGHMVTLAIDTFIPFTIPNILVPGNQPYRPFWVNLGVLGMYSMVILLVTSWVRRRLKYQLWRSLHYISFLTFVLVTAHGLFSGSDSDEPWMRAIYAGAACAVAFLTVVRMLTRAPAPKASAADDEEEDGDDEERWMRDAFLSASPRARTTRSR